MEVTTITVKALRDQLRTFPSDAEVWVLNVSPEGDVKESFKVVNVYMDHIISRAIIMADPI